MSRFLRLTVMIVTLLACIGCDQATKAMARSQLPRNEIQSFVYDTFRLQYAENKGAFLSLGASLSESLRRAFFSVGIAVVLLGVFAYIIAGPAISPTYLVSITLILGGGLSNLIDRWAYGGVVVDFLNVGIGEIRTGIFNLADVAIMAGATSIFVKGLGKK